ncbi:MULTISPECIES: DUF2973 domain-containing protein [Lyngbya]|uniref:DUF2973 domain-containing protein n=1 Tax=Lyngbya aestuarii BL J TaxID=1348334 RepID=U7QM98_9CYAN|nr:MULTISPECIES: DUF2973 domain-containing protein [Lyngbya]EAW38537.1 hypothetical protein L8106_07039 [Lyngbya sp. PCC 8106]ERT07526.1 hypothetical protein M595_2558 [Lyngbya aestuarii BL J]
MLHLIYILAFTILAFLAVRNLIHSLIVVGMESQRPPMPRNTYRDSSGILRNADHPELLDDSGNMVREPLLVMRSFSMQDARTQLDSLYQSSPNASEEAPEEKS